MAAKIDEATPTLRLFSCNNHEWPMSSHVITAHLLICFQPLILLYWTSVTLLTLEQLPPFTLQDAGGNNYHQQFDVPMKLGYFRDKKY